MTVQPGLCQTCSETTLLVFPRGCSYDNNNFNFLFKFELTNSVCYLSSRFVPVYTLQLGYSINYDSISTMLQMNQVMTKTDLYTCENKGTEHYKPDKCLCFRYINCLTLFFSLFLKLNSIEFKHVALSASAHPGL